MPQRSPGATFMRNSRSNAPARVAMSGGMMSGVVMAGVVMARVVMARVVVTGIAA